MSTYLYLLILLGYPIVALYEIFCGKQIQIASHLLGFLFILLSLLIVGKEFKKNEFKIDFYQYILAFYSLLYLFKLIISINYFGWTYLSKPIVYFVAVGFIPTIAFIVNKKNFIIDGNFLIALSIMSGAITFLILAIHYLNINPETHLQSSHRLGFLFLNPITIGNISSLAFISNLISVSKKRLSIISFIHFFLMSTALACLIFSAAKMATIGLILTCFFLLIFMNKGSYRKYIFPSAILVFTLIYFNTKFYTDITELFNHTSRSLLERIVFIKAAFNDFSQNIFLGRAVFDQEYKQYPHNFFVDILMSTGIIGMFAISIPLARAFIKIYHSIREEFFLLPAIFTIYFFDSMSSGTFWSNYRLLVTLCLLISPRVISKI